MKQMPTKKQTAVIEYTAEDRQRFLFRTAAEMRAILERVEARQAERHGETTGDSREERGMNSPNSLESCGHTLTTIRGRYEQ